MGQLFDEADPGAAVDQRKEAVAFAGGAHNGIAFPVAGLLPQFNGFGASVDHGLTLQATAFFQPEGPLAAALPALSQVPVQTAALALILAHVAIDRGMADRHAHGLA